MQHCNKLSNDTKKRNVFVQTFNFQSVMLTIFNDEYDDSETFKTRAMHAGTCHSYAFRQSSLFTLNVFPTNTRNHPPINLTLSIWRTRRSSETLYFQLEPHQMSSLIDTLARRVLIGSTIGPKNKVNVRIMFRALMSVVKVDAKRVQR